MKNKIVSCELIALWLIEKLISLEIRLNHLISFNKSLFLLRILIQIYKVFLLFYLLDDLFQRFIKIKQLSFPNHFQITFNYSPS